MAEEHWKDEPEAQDFPAAESYLSLLVGPARAAKLAKALRKQAKLYHLRRQGHPAGLRPAAVAPGRFGGQVRPAEGQDRREALTGAAGRGGPAVGRRRLPPGLRQLPPRREGPRALPDRPAHTPLASPTGGAVRPAGTAHLGQDIEAEDEGGPSPRVGRPQGPARTGGCRAGLSRRRGHRRPWPRHGPTQDGPRRVHPASPARRLRRRQRGHGTPDPRIAGHRWSVQLLQAVRPIVGPRPGAATARPAGRPGRPGSDRTRAESPTPAVGRGCIPGRGPVGEARRDWAGEPAVPDPWDPGPAGRRTVTLPHRSEAVTETPSGRSPSFHPLPATPGVKGARSTGSATKLPASRPDGGHLSPGRRVHGRSRRHYYARMPGAGSARSNSLRTRPPGVKDPGDGATRAGAVAGWTR